MVWLLLFCLLVLLSCNQSQYNHLTGVRAGVCFICWLLADLTECFIFTVGEILKPDQELNWRSCEMISRWIKWNKIILCMLFLFKCIGSLNIIFYFWAWLAMQEINQSVKGTWDSSPPPSSQRGSVEFLYCVGSWSIWLATVALCQRSGERNWDESAENVHKVTSLRLSTRREGEHPIFQVVLTSAHMCQKDVINMC